MLEVMDAATAFANKDEVCYLDVREPYEWDAGHIDGSLHMPIGDIQSRFEELDKATPIVVVCQVGQRSALVSEFLAAKGYDAQNLEGGLDAWTSRGYPLVTVTDPLGNILGGGARDMYGNRPDGGTD
jgi:rhodanese-related sulfurtransferase